MQNIISSLKSYKFLLLYSLSLEFIFMTSRLLLVWQYDIPLDPYFFLFSLRMDIIVIALLTLIPLLLFTFNFYMLLRPLLALLLFVVGYLEVANYFFFEEFGTRLNHLFFAYLEYPQEIFMMIWHDYKVILLITTPIVIFLSQYLLSILKLVQSPIRYKLLLLVILLPFWFLAIRSSLTESTPNQSFYSYSNSSLKNDIVNNTLFSLGYTSYLKTKEAWINYGILNRSIQIPSPHHQSTHFQRKKNIILILMESFGNSYVGALGGTPTTPYFDTMTKEGLFCSNMYSSSNRSNRGFEAVLSSLYPIVNDTYLKLPKSQNHFWTLARTMQKKGYKTIFLYGGDSKFDNMKGFALNNGFDQVIDIFNFDQNIPRSTWGVSDEALFKKAHTLLKESKQPLFLMLFTLSAHKPFDYPKGKIDYYNKAKPSSFANAIKYADFSLHQFYKNLKKDHFFKDGVLAMVADHNAHIFNTQIIPVKQFKIPALFITNDLAPREIKSVTHQIDIAPTLLDIAGIEATIPALGRDLITTPSSDALIVHHDAFAYLKANQFVLYQREKNPIIYDLNYIKQENNQTLIEQGLYYIYQAYHIYDKSLHKDTL
jgi:phosphoglycerol transferase MdoB-like AlkP superfamily enzyme